MNEEEKGIVKEIVQLYKELCRLTNEGNHGAHRMLPPNIHHYIRSIDEIYHKTVELHDKFHPDYLLINDVFYLDEIRSDYELRIAKYSKSFSQIELMEFLQYYTNQVEMALFNLLKINK